MPWSRSAGVGSTDGAGGPQSAASQAAVTEARTWRGGGFSVATPVLSASTQREPAALWVPKLPWRQRPPGRIARSAAWVGGAPPACRTTVHRACRRLRSARPVPSVLGPPHGLARCQQPLPCLPHGPHRAGQGPLGPRPLADPRPPPATAAGLAPHGFPHLAGASPALDHGVDVPQPMRPAHLPSPRRVPGGGAPAIRHQPPPEALPPALPGPPGHRAMRAPPTPVPHSVTAVHSQARGCPARPPVSSRSAAGGGWTDARAAATGSAPACTVACARWAIVPRPSGTPNRSSRARGVVRCDSC